MSYQDTKDIKEGVHLPAMRPRWCKTQPLLCIKLWRFQGCLKNKTSTVSKMIYSETPKIQTSIFRNTWKLEMNLGHPEFRKKDLFMNYFNKCLL